MNHHLASFYASTVNHRCKSVKCQRDFISCNASLLWKEPIAFQNKWDATLLTTKFPLDHPSGICSSVPFHPFSCDMFRAFAPKLSWSSYFSLTFPGKSYSPKCCKATQDHQTTAIPLVAPHWCTRWGPITALQDKCKNYPKNAWFSKVSSEVRSVWLGSGSTKIKKQLWVLDGFDLSTRDHLVWPKCPKLWLQVYSLRPVVSWSYIEGSVLSTNFPGPLRW